MITKPIGHKPATASWWGAIQAAKQEATAAFEWSKVHATPKASDEARDAYRIGFEQGFSKAMAFMALHGLIRWDYSAKA